jgi:hypothetical protein
LLPTNGLEKSDGKVVVVRVSVIHVNLSALLVSYGIEDMFGADDEDWAIYRKIVAIAHISVIPVTR